jgi:8-oxo-dGTP pyrophosphatase MutT (NUDIX family)
MKKSIRAGGVVVNTEGKIALTNEHLWGFPRGGVKNGESLEEAARREINEEIGLDDIEFVKELKSYERFPHGVDENVSGSFPMEIHMFLFKTKYVGKLIPKFKNVKETGWFFYDDAVEKLDNDLDRDFLKSVRLDMSQISF